MIRVLLVHDTHLLRSALAALLARDGDLDVSTTSWRDFRTVARSSLPHVCVVDVDCPGSAALTTTSGPTRSCTLPGLPDLSALVVLATASKPGLLRRASQARARGYVNKDGSPESLLRAIRQVAEGERFVDSTLALDFLQAADIPLTGRELSVLSLAAEGASVPEIARRLHLCHGTVRNYMAAINRKTGARNRVDAIRISQGAGWL
ncbi:response regulator transcription factor [Streptomyces sp. NPDC020096]